MHNTFQDESDSEKSYTLPYSYQNFEKFEERFRSLLKLTILEIKEASEEAKRNYREALKRLVA